MIVLCWFLLVAGGRGHGAGVEWGGTDRKKCGRCIGLTAKNAVGV